MKKSSIALFFAAVAAACLGLSADEPREPFYRKYLVAGNALDDRILEQERRVEAQPDSAERRNDFGNLLAARRFTEDARRQYEKALELDHSQFLAAYNLGLLYETEGKPWKAIGAYRKSIKRKPGFPHSRFRLGRLYEKRGWERLAVKEYAKALRIDPAMRDPHVNPLVIDTRLLDRASLENYPRDLAVASMGASAGWSDEARFRAVPVDRPVWASEVGDPSAPEPADAIVSPPGQSPAPVALPLAPGQTRPQRGEPPQPAPAPETAPARPPYLGGSSPAAPPPTPVP